MKDNISMGIGDLGKPDTVFSRKFRWTLEGDNLRSWFTKDVSFDYVNKTVKFSYYDVVSDGKGMDALVWADKLQSRQLADETLTFTAYDGCGKALYKLTFFDLKLTSHTADFDYEDSSPAVTVITVKYGTVHKKLIGCPDQFSRYSWKLFIKDIEVPMYWDDGGIRPTLSIEENELNFLNAKTFIPGKAKWHDAKIKTNAAVRSALTNYLNGERFECELRMVQDDTNLESWFLEKAWIKSLDVSDAETLITMSYGSCRYVNHKTTKPVVYPVITKKEPWTCPLTGHVHYKPAEKVEVPTPPPMPDIQFPKIELPPLNGIQIQSVSGHVIQMNDQTPGCNCPPSQ